jgi:16S rRNA processing protein RimM
MSSRSSKTDRAAGDPKSREARSGRQGSEPPAETVVVATVRRPHGLRGDLLVDLHSDVPGRLDVGRSLLLVDARGRRERVRIDQSRMRGAEGLIRLEGREDRNQVEALRGATLEVEREEVPPAPEGSYYFFDLVGTRCVDRRDGDLGVVREVIEDGGGYLLRIAGETREVLVPFVRAYLVSVDLPAGRIDVDLPEGLVETCASPS